MLAFHSNNSYSNLPHCYLVLHCLNAHRIFQVQRYSYCHRFIVIKSRSLVNVLLKKVTFMFALYRKCCTLLSVIYVTFTYNDTCWLFQQTFIFYPVTEMLCNPGCFNGEFSYSKDSHYFHSWANTSSELVTKLWGIFRWPQYVDLRMRYCIVLLSLINCGRE